MVQQLGEVGGRVGGTCTAGDESHGARPAGLHVARVTLPSHCASLSAVQPGDGDEVCAAVQPRPGAQ